MVFRTFVRRATHAGFSKVNSDLPGLSVSSAKHHPGVIPVHFFTIGGVLVSAWYCLKLLTYQDTTINRWKQFQDIKPNAQIPVFMRVVDLKNRKDPEAKPKLEE